MKPSLIQRLRDRTLPPICNEAADQLIELEKEVRSYEVMFAALKRFVEDIDDTK